MGIEDDNISLMDPNFGEVSFKNKENFKNWFTSNNEMLWPDLIAYDEGVFILPKPHVEGIPKTV